MSDSASKSMYMRIRKNLFYIPLIAFTIYFLFPIFFVIVTSLKTSIEIFRDPFALPSNPQFQNYVNAWITGNLGKYALNSVIMSVPTVLCRVFFSALAAYAFTYLKFHGRKPLFYFFLLGLMVPEHIALIPVYRLLLGMGLLDTYWAVILPYIGFGLPFSILIMANYFKTIPKAIFESATLDGCGDFGLFWRIAFPLSLPAVTALFALNFMWMWNNLLFPLVFIEDDSLRPITVGLLYFRDRYDINYGLLSAGAVIAAIPIIILYVILAKYFLRGLVLGGIKG